MKDYNKKSVCGVGYIGIGKYPTTINGKTTKAYQTWQGMITRCYNPNYQLTRPTYAGCQVHSEWHCFQKYAEWHEKNHIDGYVLDKDILYKDNKLYSSQTCVFIPHEINSLFIKSNNIRGLYPIGVSYNKKGNKFKAYLKKYGKLVYLGWFDTPEEAFKTYKAQKELYAKEIAEKFKKEISIELYNSISNYVVNIND